MLRGISQCDACRLALMVVMLCASYRRNVEAAVWKVDLLGGMWKCCVEHGPVLWTWMVEHGLVVWNVGLYVRTWGGRYELVVWNVGMLYRKWTCSVECGYGWWKIDL